MKDRTEMLTAIEEADDLLRQSAKLFNEISKTANTIMVISHSAANGNDIGTAFAALDVAEKFAENIDGSLDELRCNVEVARHRLANGMSEPEAEEGDE